MFYIGLLHNLCNITKSELSTSEYKINAPSKVFEIVLYYFTNRFMHVLHHNYPTLSECEFWSKILVPGVPDQKF